MKSHLTAANNNPALALSKCVGCSYEVAREYLGTLAPARWCDLIQLLNNGDTEGVERFTGGGMIFL